MTFIVGLTCADGIVLCSDSLEDDGITKKTVNKIQMMGGDRWALAIAGAGPGQTIDRFCEEIRAALPKGPFDRRLIVSTVENVLAAFQAKYIQERSDEFQVIAAVYALPFTKLLYQGSCFLKSSVVLAPIGDECQIGCGNDLWRFISDNLYSKRNGVEDNIRLAIFATRLAIKHASGVGEPVQLVSHGFGDEFWKSPSKNEIKAIESELSHESLKDALQNFWRLHNPPTRSEQMLKYRGMRTPGDELTLLDGVKIEELRTTSGRRRASKIFAHNRGRLQQRASLERERIAVQRGEARQSPSSGRKTRT